jgi:hypothetical protein
LDTLNFYTASLGVVELEKEAQKAGYIVDVVTSGGSTDIFTRRQLRGTQDERRLGFCWINGVNYSTCPLCYDRFGTYTCSMYCTGTGGELNCRRRLEEAKIPKSSVDPKAGAKCTLLSNGQKDALTVARENDFTFPPNCAPRDTNLKVYSCIMKD